MTDLSKDLGEMRGRATELDAMDTIPPDLLQAYFCWAHEDRSRLLSIIETEIPGMLRARAEELSQTKSHYDGCAAAELADAATAIESLTKNEKEKG